MSNNFTLTALVPATPAEVYEAWLSTEGHTAMTGSPATVDDAVGGKFTAWDGYIFGTTLEVTPNERIVQAWRTSEFPEDAPDSRVEILFEAVASGTQLTLVHSNMPDDQVDEYRQGWDDFYFKPMLEWFGK